jgi:hypothetical protein
MGASLHQENAVFIRMRQSTWVLRLEATFLQSLLLPPKLLTSL